MMRKFAVFRGRQAWDVTNIPRVALALVAMAPFLACGESAPKSARESTASPDSGAPSNAAVLTVTIATGKGSVRIGGVSGATPTSSTCSDQCDLYLDDSSNALLGADPEEGWVLDAWDGGCTGWHTCTVLVTGHQSVTARFRSAPQPAKAIPYDALDLSRLDGPSAVTDAEVLDDTGAVAGRICDAPPFCASMRWDLFRWDGTLQRFHIEDGVRAWIAATSAGHIAGALEKADGSHRAFITAGSDLVELPTLGGDSFVRAMNASGLAVGESVTASGERHAVAWKDGSIIDLHARTGMAQSRAMAVDESGKVGVLACRQGAVPVGCRAMVLTDSSTAHLGAVPDEMSPFSMSVQGSLVGATHGEGVEHAAAWIAGQTIDLDRDITALPWLGIGAGRPGGLLGSVLWAVGASGDAVGEVNIAISEGAAATAILRRDGTLFELAAGVQPQMRLHSGIAINAKGQILARRRQEGYEQVLLTPR
jgi:probable HAF family extracellular repeat protein